MKSEKSLKVSISVLLVCVIAVMGFIRGTLQSWLLIGIFTAWGIWVVCKLLIPFIKKAKRESRRKVILRGYQRGSSSAGTNAGIADSDCEPAEIVLLRHVNLRITEHIRSIYPDATWEWQEKHPERLIMSGGVGRICVHGIKDYDHADIKIDKRGTISCSMVKIVPMRRTETADGDAENQPPNKQPVNPQIWYEVQGRSVLQNIIADLHSRGHSHLTINEDGEIFITQDSKDVSTEQLSNFPKKVYWDQLVKVFHSEGLAAEIVPKGLQVTW